MSQNTTKFFRWCYFKLKKVKKSKQLSCVFTHLKPSPFCNKTSEHSVTGLRFDPRTSQIRSQEYYPLCCSAL